MTGEKILRPEADKGKKPEKEIKAHIEIPIVVWFEMCDRIKQEYKELGKRFGIKSIWP